MSLRLGRLGNHSLCIGHLISHSRQRFWNMRKHWNFGQEYLKPPLDTFWFDTIWYNFWFVKNVIEPPVSNHDPNTVCVGMHATWDLNLVDQFEWKCTLISLPTSSFSFALCIYSTSRKVTYFSSSFAIKLRLYAQFHFYGKEKNEQKLFIIIIKNSVFPNSSIVKNGGTNSFITWYLFSFS